MHNLSNRHSRFRGNDKIVSFMWLCKALDLKILVLTVFKVTRAENVSH